MLYEKVFRVILSYKKRLFKKLHKKKPLEKLKRRQYYRTHAPQILQRRKRYLAKNKPFLKTRKLHKRRKPAWMSHKPKTHKFKVIRPKKRPAFKPKAFKPRKIHAPKRA